MESVTEARVREIIEGYFNTYDVRVQDANKKTQEAVALISARTEEVTEFLEGVEDAGGGHQGQHGGAEREAA